MKGFITIDGVSLTVAGVGKTYFEVALIPHTAERTTLGALRVGRGGEPRGRHGREVRGAFAAQVVT